MNNLLEHEFEGFNIVEDLRVQIIRELFKRVADIPEVFRTFSQENQDLIFMAELLGKNSLLSPSVDIMFNSLSDRDREVAVLLPARIKKIKSMQTEAEFVSYIEKLRNIRNRNYLNYNFLLVSTL